MHGNPYFQRTDEKIFEEPMAPACSVSDRTGGDFHGHGAAAVTGNDERPEHVVV